MTADRDQATRDRLAEAWNDSEWVAIGSGEDRRIVMAEEHERWEAVARVVAELVREGQAEALREFYLDAADRATALGRRGPNAVADWLLDLGSEAVAALRAPREATP